MRHRMNKMIMIKNAKILTDSFEFCKGTLIIQDEIIQDIIYEAPQAENDEVSFSDKMLPDTEEVTVIDAKDRMLIPGLIDVHMHGYYGTACSCPDAEEIRNIGRHLVKEGVTGYAASISSTFDDKALAGIDANVKAIDLEKEDLTGSRILGIHMEGPFLNPVKKGAMNENAIKLPDARLFQEYLDHAKGNLKIMTMAPEMEGALELTREANKNGVKISMGHTNATYEEARKGIEAGMSRATHTFNAMRSLNHRESGILGAVLTDDSIECEMISDFVHVAPEVCLMIYRLKGADRVTVISDSMQLAGLKQEDLPKDLPVILGKAAYLKNGTLCGSIGTVMTGVRNLNSIGIPLNDCIKMASYNPARDLGMEKETGSIRIGKKADLVLIDDSLNVSRVFVRGKELFKDSE